MYFKNEFMLFFVLLSGMEDRFLSYATEDEHSFSFILTVFNILLSILSLLVYKYAIKKNPKIYSFYCTFALSLYFYPISMRISLYFAVIMMVWIPYLLDALGGNNLHMRQLIYLLTIALFIVLTMFTIASWDEYKFFWQYMPIPY